MPKNELIIKHIFFTTLLCLSFHPKLYTSAYVMLCFSPVYVLSFLSFFMKEDLYFLTLGCLFDVAVFLLYWVYLLFSPIFQSFSISIKELLCCWGLLPYFSGTLAKSAPCPSHPQPSLPPTPKPSPSLTNPHTLCVKRHKNLISDRKSNSINALDYNGIHTSLNRL